MSITSPSSSTARHKYGCRPRSRTNTSSRYQVSPCYGGYTAAAAGNVYEELLRRVAAVPGVERRRRVDHVAQAAPADRARIRLCRREARRTASRFLPRHFAS